MKKERNNGRKASSEMMKIPSADGELDSRGRREVGRRSFFKGYKTFMKRFISVCVFCLAGTAAAMGSGSGGGGGGGGGGGSAASNPFQQEVGASAFKAYNQGVDLMHVRKFAAAQAMFERAIRDKMPESYEYRGVLFAKMGRKADAEKDLATLKKLNPKLAGELEQFLKTGREVEEYGGTSPKQNS